MFNFYSFKNDYGEGAHPKLLEALAKASCEQNIAYGNDVHSEHARNLIRERIGCPDADIHFLEGGTQTNLIAISAFLRPHEAAIAAETGHINTHETGAVEATGHKILTCTAQDGKLTAHDVERIVALHPDEHVVKPKLVYISDSTEIGTIYSKSELSDLHRVCKQYDLYLYLDGARLGSALTSSENDLTMQEIAEWTDAFYIGGTKNGALLGEALVIRNPALKDGFRYILKQKGAMLAKGMVLGAQFERFFEDDLYFELAAHANKMALRLYEAIKDAGFHFLSPSSTNQIFPVLPNQLVEQLSEHYAFEIWDRPTEGETAIRLVTSWATPEDAVGCFIDDFNRLTH